MALDNISSHPRGQACALFRQCFYVAHKTIEVQRKRIVKLEAEHADLLALTMKLSEHPAGYKGPCLCAKCRR